MKLIPSWINKVVLPVFSFLIELVIPFHLNNSLQLLKPLRVFQFIVQISHDAIFITINWLKILCHRPTKILEKVVIMFYGGCFPFLGLFLVEYLKQIKVLIVWRGWLHVGYIPMCYSRGVVDVWFDIISGQSLAEDVPLFGFYLVQKILTFLKCVLSAHWSGVWSFVGHIEKLLIFLLDINSL